MSPHRINFTQNALPLQTSFQDTTSAMRWVYNTEKPGTFHEMMVFIWYVLGKGHRAAHCYLSFHEFLMFPSHIWPRAFATLRHSFPFRMLPSTPLHSALCTREHKLSICGSWYIGYHKTVYLQSLTLFFMALVYTISTDAMWAQSIMTFIFHRKETEDLHSQVFIW